MGATLFLGQSAVYIDTLDKNSEKYANDVTHFPVESGESVTDDIINKNPQIDIVGYVSAYPIVFMGGLSRTSIKVWDSIKAGHIVEKKYSSPNDAKQLLIQFWEMQKPIGITINDENFQNAAIKQLHFNYDKDTGDSLLVTLSLELIKIVKSKTTIVPQNISDSKVRDDMSKKKDLGVKPTKPTSFLYDAGKEVKDRLKAAL